MATERPGPSRLLTGAFLAAALIVGAALGAQEINGLASPLDRIENLTLDWRFLLAGARPAPSGVVIVAIDDEALSEAGSDALARNDGSPRAALAGFHPRSIAIDIAFLNSKGEERMRNSLARSRRRQPSSRRSECSTQPIVLSGSRAERPGVGAEAVLRSLADRGDPRCGASGTCECFDDSSGVPRYIPMIYQTPDGVLPLSRSPRRSRRLRSSRSWVLTGSRSQGSREQWTSAITCRCVLSGPREASGDQRTSGSPRRPRSANARGKVVVVGVTATGASDTFATPFDRVAPGAEVFATAIGNLMAGDGLARTPSTRRIDAAAAVALPFVMIALMAMRRAAIGLALASLVFVLWLAAVFLAFVHGYWLSVAAPLASALPLTVGFAAARSIVERRAGQESQPRGRRWPGFTRRSFSTSSPRA